MGQISEINKKMRKYRKLLADFCLLFMSKIEKIMFKKRSNFSTPQPLQHPIFTHTYTLHKSPPTIIKPTRNPLTITTPYLHANHASKPPLTTMKCTFNPLMNTTPYRSRAFLLFIPIFPIS